MITATEMQETLHEWGYEVEGVLTMRGTTFHREAAVNDYDNRRILLMALEDAVEDMLRINEEIK